MSNRILAVLVGVLLVGCGDPESPPVRQVPVPVLAKPVPLTPVLAAFPLELSLGDAKVTGPVRFAVIWTLPDSNGGFAGIDPEEVSATVVNGKASATVSIHALPPETAILLDPSNGEKSAIATVIAYEDSNGNGVLDTRGHGVGHIDRILASSISGQAYVPRADQIEIRYQDTGTVPFHLVDVAGATSEPSLIAMHVEQNVWNNLFICSDGASDDPVASGNCLCDTSDQLSVWSYPNASPGSRAVDVLVIACGPAPVSPEVTLNGTPMSFDTSRGMFHFEESTPGVTAGKNTLHVTAPGHTERSVSWEIPEVHLTSPAPGSKVHAKNNLSLTWTSSLPSVAMLVAIEKVGIETPWWNLLATSDSSTNEVPVPGGMLGAQKVTFTTVAFQQSSQGDFTLPTSSSEAGFTLIP